MTTLADLFPPAPAAEVTAQRRARRSLRGVVAPTPETAAHVKTDGLARLFDGERPAGLQSAEPSSPHDATALARYVAAAEAMAPSGQAAVGLGDAPTVQRRAPRGRSTRDWLAIGLAVFAGLAVIATTLLAVRAVASSSPTDDALRTLTQSEAVLVNEMRAIDSAIARFDTGRAASTATGEALAEPLAAVAGMSDETARVAAEAARTDYLAALAALPVVSPPAAYPAAAVGDSTSLAELAQAIDDVAAREIDLAAASDEVDAAAAQLFALDSDFEAALRAFAATVPATAAEIVAANPDADESFRTAVTDAANAAAAASADALGASLTTYAQAVTALQADQTRALEVLARLIAEQQARTPSTGSGGTSTDPATDDGGTETPDAGTGDTDPTTPVEPDPTTPVEPDPTTPVEPDPTPTPTQ